MKTRSESISDLSLNSELMRSTDCSLKTVTHIGGNCDCDCCDYTKVPKKEEVIIPPPIKQSPFEKLLTAAKATTVSNRHERAAILSDATKLNLSDDEIQLLLKAMNLATDLPFKASDFPFFAFMFNKYKDRESWNKGAFIVGDVVWNWRLMKRGVVTIIRHPGENNEMYIVEYDDIPKPNVLTSVLYYWIIPWNAYIKAVNEFKTGIAEPEENTFEELFKKAKSPSTSWAPRKQLELLETIQDLPNLTDNEVKKLLYAMGFRPPEYKDLERSDLPLFVFMFDRYKNRKQFPENIQSTFKVGDKVRNWRLMKDGTIEAVINPKYGGENYNVKYDDMSNVVTYYNAIIPFDEYALALEEFEKEMGPKQGQVGGGDPTMTEDFLNDLLVQLNGGAKEPKKIKGTRKLTTEYDQLDRAMADESNQIHKQVLTMIIKFLPKIDKKYTKLGELDLEDIGRNYKAVLWQLVKKNKELVNNIDKSKKLLELTTLTELKKINPEEGKQLREESRKRREERQKDKQKPKDDVKVVEGYYDLSD